jgi:hypothetical protein
VAAGRFRSVAQLVEHRSPKPGVAGSIPAGPVRANDFGDADHRGKVVVVVRGQSRTETGIPAELGTDEKR